MSFSSLNPYSPSRNPTAYAQREAANQARQDEWRSKLKDPLYQGIARQLGIQNLDSYNDILQIEQYLRSGNAINIGNLNQGDYQAGRGGYDYENLGYEAELSGQAKKLGNQYEEQGAYANSLSEQYNAESAELRKQIDELTLQQGFDPLPLPLFVPQTDMDKTPYYNNPGYQDAAQFLGLGTLDSAQEIMAVQDYLLSDPNYNYAEPLPLARIQGPNEQTTGLEDYLSNPIYQRAAYQMGMQNVDRVGKVRQIEDYLIGQGFYDPAMVNDPYIAQLESMYMAMEEEYKTALNQAQQQMQATQAALNANIKMQNNLANAFVPAPEMTAASITVGDQREPARERQATNTLSRLTLGTGTALGSADPMTAIAGLALA